MARKGRLAAAEIVAALEGAGYEVDNPAAVLLIEARKGETYLRASEQRGGWVLQDARYARAASRVRLVRSAEEARAFAAEVAGNTPSGLAGV